ncbi:hypothetical protein HZA38_00170 [Candidatus Peregrinibacteria bacterium]|nr:hypothetical protein [Candidatus Peregrinibacteria bacterium]
MQESLPDICTERNKFAVITCENGIRFNVFFDLTRSLLILKWTDGTQINMTLDANNLAELRSAKTVREFEDALSKFFQKNPPQRDMEIRNISAILFDSVAPFKK